MTQGQWERAKEIFDVACDLEQDKQAAYVQSVCSDDSTLLSEVESLLAADKERRETQEGADSDYLKPNWFHPPTPPVPSLKTGEVISGRFRIIRQLGKGGMGEVYEAHDSELGVQVALKTLHPEIAANPEILTRFRQEVRIAHRITHSNVCRTFQFDREIGHVGADGGDPVDLTFITMEFLDGETLQQILKSTGRLPIERAHSIATQMAEAVEAAHHTGIIHRDIKPGNVMICPGRNGEQDRVVVTDFGLAKIDISAPGANPELSAISHAGHAIGTLAYMAPEQLDAKPVSPATDVYAFGLVLYEMVTGQKAFPEVKTYADACRRLYEDPPNPRNVIPALPVEWARAILCCLQIDPAKRLQHVTDVIAVLEGANPIELRKSSVSHHSSRARQLAPQRLPNTRRRWMLPMAAILLLCVSLSWPAYRLYQWRANSTVAPGTLVYLAPVKNETGEKQLDNITELVQAGLSQSAHINLLDAGRVSDILQHMTKPPDTAITPEIAREIAMRGNAPRLVTGLLSHTGDKFSLLITIEQPDNQPGRARHSWPKTWIWKEASDVDSGPRISLKLLENIREASSWIRKQVGESPDDIVRLDTPPEDVTTGSWEALENYEQALTLSNHGQRADAVLALQRAVQKDPQFALAYAVMADLLFSLHREIDGLRAYEKALDSGLQNRLTRREEDRIRGMKAVDTADYQLAVDAFHDYTINYKNDYIGWIYPTLPLRLLKRDEQAISNLRIAIPLAPDQSFAPHELANELILQGRQEEALQWVTYLKQHNHPESATQVEIALAFVNRRYGDALKLIESLNRSADPARRSNSFAETASLLAEVGKYQQAIAALNQGLVEDDAQHNLDQRAVHLLDRAYLEYKLHDFASCLQDVHSGYSINPGPQNILRVDTILGNTYTIAPTQFRVRIRQELQAIMRSLPPQEYGNLAETVRLRTSGELFLTRNDPESAIRVFEQLDKRDDLAGSREYLIRAIFANTKLSGNRVSREAQDTAKELQSNMTLTPAFVWCNPNAFLPGVYADEIEKLLLLSKTVGAPANSSDFLRAALSYIRPERVRVQ